MDLNLNNKVVLVTGSAQGIGKAGVMRFLDEGAIVYGGDVNQDQLESLKQERPSEKLHPLFFDVTDSQSVANGVAKIVAAEGQIDVLFHNAMSAEYVNNRDRSVTELSEEVWTKIRTLVLDGTYHCLKYVGQVMEKQGSGSIILTSTVDALIGCPGFDAYVASKGAIVALVRSVAANLSPKGVRVNSIAPGFVKTPAQMGFIDDPQLKKLHLMDIAEPEEIANVALFLASNVSRVITGTTLVADSGYLCFKGDLEQFDNMVVTKEGSE
jgi:NAD(P)-dependent dehydrogenase (short-subunit alcohol dehydrogenase family)